MDPSTAERELRYLEELWEFAEHGPEAGAPVSPVPINDGTGTTADGQSLSLPGDAEPQSRGLLRDSAAHITEPVASREAMEHRRLEALAARSRKRRRRRERARQAAEGREASDRMRNAIRDARDGRKSAIRRLREMTNNIRGVVDKAKEDHVAALEKRHRAIAELKQNLDASKAKVAMQATAFR
ncbi:unnamed protein product [Ostreobium quekettii]|uniref:Uncharacterized protein n=1 Tax=Ostreobium quekettii TaxID=121088 RepID=A0A8S1IMA2_9CHLO|nr:unnamed protein product [Ostreobium quekettii]